MYLKKKFIASFIYLFIYFIYLSKMLYAMHSISVNVKLMSQFSTFIRSAVEKGVPDVLRSP